jgi:hypothetical protein
MKGKLIKCNHFYALQIGSDIIAVSLARETLEHKVNYEHSLSKQNCDEIFGVVDVDILATEHYQKFDNLPVIRYNSFTAGFNKAIELNKDKLYTIENIRKAMSAGLSIGYGRQFEIEDKQFEIDAYTQELQLPPEIDVEVEMDRIPADLAPSGWDVFPKLDESGCLILKKVL